MLKINGKPVEATHVAWDGCHKFFLIADDEDEGTVRDCGYTDADIYPVEDIPDLWEQSCFLKAIWWPWTSDRETLVEQGDDEPVFEVVS